MKTKSILLGGLMCLMVFIMTACSGSVEDSEDAMLTIDFGNFETQDLVKNENIVYKIDIADYNTGQPYLSFPANKGQQIQKKVALGDYTVSVVVFKDSINGEEFAKGNSGGKVKVATGINNVRIQLNLVDSVPLTVDPYGGTHSVTEAPFKITLTSDIGVPIEYTLTGAQIGSGTLTGAGQISITTAGTTTLKAIARGSGILSDSLPLTEVYTLNNGWTANVNSTSHTTAITFTFGLPVTGLAAEDISISGGFTKGTLTGSGTTWTLNGIPTIGGANPISVSINKTGVTSEAQLVTIYGENGKFPLWAAVGDSKFGAEGISDIAWGNDKFVAVGTGGQMAYSSDGINWTAVTDSTFGSTTISSIAWGNDKFVAVGYNGKMANSSDGITWTAVTDSTFVFQIRGIAWGSDKFVAGGNNGKMAISPEGIIWITVTNNTFMNNIFGITWGNGKFVAVGTGGKMAYSSDGITWITVTNNTFTNNINGITWGNNKFVAVGYSGKIAYSSDGINWTAVTDSTFGTSHANAVAWGGNRFLAGGTSGKAAYSSDGITWTAVANSTFGSSGINGIAWANNKFVAVGDDGKIAYSLTE